ncbi:uncharacterized protein LOC130569459 [Triplophysa rosa]|uniref:uncharacterized protein LOC130569459 n=1 Tax=Triplophysa rosa TaxID=992332 RepID=UPI002545F102|nr:uncharacterized protein LOC130569459 [Triplophysa rosa]
MILKKYNFTFNTCGFQRDFNKAHRSWIMGGVSVDLLFLLVLIFKAACEDDDFSNVACYGVTGHQESTLNCTVIYSNRCHAMLYKFINKDKDTTICREKFTSKSDQQHFSCSYTSKEDMTTTFQFFLQADCGTVIKEFTVAGGSSRIKGDPAKETSVLTDKAGVAVVMAGISCFIIFVMGFILIRKHNAKNTCGIQKNCVFVCDDNNFKKHPDRETV